ncbi:MAG: dephospho-CoA kinase [Flavobacteriales bacterium]|jgi:dephospho-CoA kinase|nr:dephospho-CoA kinase [Flavobacteriia bacterium]
MKRIGLTGNIGSGKTTVASCFEILGIAVFNADKQAKLLMNKDVNLKQSLIAEFGKEVFLNNELNRKYLSKLAFNDDLVLKRLNALVHPVVQEAFEKWSIQQSGAYVIKEAAILFESNTYQSLDAIICISCPEEIRLKRILKRDDLSEKDVRQRMSHQWAEEKKISLSDYVITNDNSSLVMPQILSVHSALK